MGGANEHPHNSGSAGTPSQRHTWSTRAGAHVMPVLPDSSPVDELVPAVLLSLVVELSSSVPLVVGSAMLVAPGPVDPPDDDSLVLSSPEDPELSSVGIGSWTASQPRRRESAAVRRMGVFMAGVLTGLSGARSDFRPS